MVKRKSLQKVLFAHSAGPQYGKGKGSYDLVKYLRVQLAGQFRILFPVIKQPALPTYGKYKKIFAESFRKIEGPVILIGHSLGASTLLKYLSEEKPVVNIAALFLVSTPHWGSDMKEFELKKNFQHFLPMIPAIYLYHSKKDPVAPFESLKYYEAAFPTASIRVLPGKEHEFPHGLPELIDDIATLSIK